MKLKIYFNSVLSIVLVLIFSSLNIVSAQEIKSSALKQIQSLLDEKESRTPAQKKMDSQLWYAIKMGRGQAISTEVATLQVNVNKDASGKVLVEINSKVTDGLLQAISSAGGEVISKSSQFERVTARLPLQSLEQLASLPEVKSIYLSYPAQHGSGRVSNTEINKASSSRIVGEIPFRRTTGPEIQKFRPGFELRAETVRQQVIKALAAEGFRPEDLPVGAATSQGDVTHKAATARTTFGVNGAGIKIGILSDSYNSLGAAATNIAAGDLPGAGNPNGFTTPITVLSDVSDGSDEGRAMLQIVHDLAPGAQLFFATANISEVSFAQGILNLRAAGCDIICDDVSYFDEPVFQDGIVAQAVNTVTASGALYFSSAGNAGNKNDNTAGVWEGDFVDGGASAAPLPLTGNVHNFGSGTNNQLLASTGVIGLFWSDPQGASNNDYDVFVLNSGLTAVVASGTNVQTGTQNPIELFAGPTPPNNTFSTGVRIMILKKTGAAIRALHLNTFRGALSASTSGITHGHGSAAAAFSVAATPANTPFGSSPPNPTGPFPGPFVGTNTVELFSSDGPRRMFYTAAGVAITPGNVLFGTNGGVVRQKPDITAADGVSTATFTAASGLNPFFGTSAAAPHAASIAALLKQRSPLLTPAQIRTALTSTAIDIEAPGVDRDAGAGIVMALEALQSVTATPGLVTAGSTIVTESCTPGNGVIDPGESVTVSFCVQNVGGTATTNLVGTLLATGGVTGPGAPQNYGVLTVGGAAVCRNFTFSNNGTCGGSITASIQFQDGATNLGTFTYTFQLGVPIVTQNITFDAVVAPALPTGWTTDFTGSGSAWVTSTANPFSAPNAAFGQETATTGVTNLNSPTIAITNSNAKLSFRNLFNTEEGFDGELLEIKIGAGVFQDIITAGGSFVSGGYNGDLDASTAFPNRNAWTGLSGGGTPATPVYINTVVNLPAAAAGQNIQLRWRVTSDNAVVASGSAGVKIDNITITDGATCCVTLPGPTVTINQAGAQADPTAVSPINFTVVFSEAVTGFATGDVTLSGTAGATTATVTGSGTTYNVAVTGMTANGTVIATIPANIAINAGSFGNNASTSTDNTVTFNGIPSTVTINQAVGQPDPTATSPINFTVVFNEAVTGFTTGDVTLSGTALATTATVTGSGTTYNVAVTGMTASGTVIATIAAGVAVNAGSVGNLASTSTDNTVNYLATPPSVTINQAATQTDPAVSSPVNFTAIFNEPVTGFTGTDVSFAGSTVTGTLVATITGGPTTYNVAVSGMTSAGNVVASIPAGGANDIDGNGNTASTSTDNTVAFVNCVLTCPANITVSATAGLCGAIVNYPAPTSTAGCGTVTSTPASGSFFPVGPTTVNVTTSAGATCSFTITVNDTQAPVVTCPAPIVVSNTTGQCGAIVNFTSTATDNCSPVSLTQSSSTTIVTGNSAACPTGITSFWRAYQLTSAWAVTFDKVTFGIESAAGASKQITVRLYTSAGAFPGGVRTQVASQTYTIPAQTNSLFTATLTTPAVVPGNAILVAEVSSDVATGAFFIGSNAAAETAPSFISAVACGSPTPVTFASLGFPNAHIVLNVSGFIPITITSVPASGSFFPVGATPTTVTTTATDAAGNTSQCTFTVKVNDTQAPSFTTCPGNITVTAAVGVCNAPATYTVAATDNCSGVTVTRTVGPASGSSFPVGVTTITHVATDASGNTATCTFTVTVVDPQLPVITTQPANRTVCAGTAATFSVTATNAISYQWQLWSGTAWNNIAGATASTYTTAAATTAMNDGSYRVIVTGLCSSVTSGFATLSVNPLPIVSLAASASPVLLPTQSISLIPTVSPAGGTFAWFKNGAAYTGSITNLKVEDAGTYRFVYTDLNGCVSTSNDVIVSAQVSGNFYVYPNPSFGQFSVRFFNNPNESVTVSVFNSAGQKIASKTVVTAAYAYTKIDVDLGARISSGIYLVELHGSDGKLKGSKRVIVEHK